MPHLLRIRLGLVAHPEMVVLRPFGLHHERMQIRRQKDSSVAQVEKTVSWHAAYDKITVPVRAEWQALELSLRRLGRSIL